MTSTHSSSPIKRGSPHLQKASDAVRFLKSSNALTEVTCEKFLTHHLQVGCEKPRAELVWTQAQRELVESIAQVKQGHEEELYTDSAPLLGLCNSISKSVFDSLANPPKTALVFYSCHNKKLVHPFSEPSLSPDLIVLYSPEDESLELPKDQNWSNIVAIGEAKVNKDAKYQTGNYLRNHLQLRPDLNFVLGFSAKTSGYSLFYHDASVIQHTPPIKWIPGPLYAFVRRLYQGLPCDPSMVNLEPGANHPRPSWSIRIESHIFVVESAKPDPGLGKRRFTAMARHAETRERWFIKDFYCNDGRRFNEGVLYDKAHKGRVIPGLMRAEHHGYVLHADGTVIQTTEYSPGSDKHVPGRRSKMRVATRDVGLALSEIKTLSQFLRVMYDACVVQRNLYRKCKILHRDISDSNILVAPKSEGVGESQVGGYDEVKYLNQVLESSVDPQPACLVIDLGNGADLDAEREDSGVLAERTGTPKFISRSVAAGELLSRTVFRVDGVDMPILDGAALQLYTSGGDSTYQKYNRKALSPSSPPTSLASPEFTHRLFHDAESTFWVTAWFLARSAPKGYQEETKWGQKFTTFVNGMESHYPDPDHPDPRLGFSPEAWESIIHPGLRLRMAPMLSRMHTYILPEWGYRPDLDPEHVHEALMRLLLLEIVRIRDGEPDVEFHTGTRTLPTKSKPTSSFSNSLTTVSLTAPTNPKKRSRSQEGDDTEPDAGIRPSPRQKELQLHGTAVVDGDCVEKLLAVAQNHPWTQMTEWLKRPNCAPSTHSESGIVPT